MKWGIYMKIKCDVCGKEINWWETTEVEGKLSACPACDMALTKEQKDKKEKRVG